MRFLVTALLAATASPALAADYPFVSLRNTDFVVLIAFVIFIGILLYYKVPALVAGMLDKRAANISAELDEAKALREEAMALLASYERKQKDVQLQADRIVAAAKQEATDAASAAKDEIAKSISRRMLAAEELIASAQAAAIKDVRDQAVVVAVAVAKDVLAGQMNAKSAGALIDDAIATVGDKLH
ncbi:F0F1 ATP synthase subunit B [Yoonia vestfoldensis]|jgi:F-type H+-transporting ATPase subunit b|uniref:ATP synthase subunit b n=1 Tax=Yoonia vestfoldensis TaxID=245188 RepID=A0A1Y0EEE6_9RHOB|nr:F0F1 ATP synthase subunit B [Yoonia vestfoldensis]ARU01997.1 ATP synthase subunit b [Yoonia vestfoldensis]